jgi:uncharacterized membrane protein YdjX (TVP38/TMEM64 family)
MGLWAFVDNRRCAVEPMQSKRRPRVTTSLVVAGVLLGTMAAGLVMPVERWVTQLGGLLGDQGLLGVAVYSVLFVICALTFVPAAPLCFMAGFLWGSWGILLAWACLIAAASTALPAARYLLQGPTDSILNARPRLHIFKEVIEEESWRAVLLLRLSGAAPFGLQNLIVAATRIRLLPYLAATMVGVVPNVVLYAGSGAFGRAAVEGHQFLRVTVLSLSICGAILLIGIAGTKMRVRLMTARRHSA